MLNDGAPNYHRVHTRFQNMGQYSLRTTLQEFNLK